MSTLLSSDVVEVIILLRNVDLLLELIDAGSLVDEGELPLCQVTQTLLLFYLV